MRKQFAILIGAGAVCASGAVFAEDQYDLPQFYGQIGYELQMLDKDISEADGVDWRSYLSRFGVRNSHTINDSLEVTYQVESFILHKTAGDNLGLRNTYGGINSDSFGELRFGRHDTPYKRANIPCAGGANMLFDAGTGSSAGNNNMLGEFKTKQKGDDKEIILGKGFIANRFERWHGTLHYISPDLSGVRVEAAIRPVQDDNGTESWVDYSTAITYRPNRTVMLNAAYESEGDFDAPYGGSGVYKSWLVGALFMPTEWLSLGAQLDSLEIDLNDDINGDMLGVTVPVKMSFGAYYVNTFLKYDEFDYSHEPGGTGTATEEDDNWLDIGMQTGYFLDNERKAQVYAVAASAEDIEGVNYGVGFRYKW